MSVVVVGEEPGVIERVSTNGTDPEGTGVSAFNEAACIAGGLGHVPASYLMPLAMANALKLEKIVFQKGLLRLWHRNIGEKTSK